MNTSVPSVRRWHVIDVSGKVLGRVATKMSGLLIGKHHVGYAPNVDMGDYVVAINIKDVVLTGKKQEKKQYFWHTGYPKGFRQRSFKEMRERDPIRILTHAVAGMLPKNKLRSARLKRLKVFADAQHPYQDKLTAS